MHGKFIQTLILAFTGIFCLCSSAGFALAEEHRGNPVRVPSPFVSFLEKSLLKVPATREIRAGDLNGDGSLDLVFLTPDPGVFWVSQGDGKGNFSLPKRHGFGRGYSNEVVGETLIIGDVNGDGRDECIHFQKRRITSDEREATLFLVSSSLDERGIFKDHLAIPLSGMPAHSRDQLLLYGNDLDGDNRPDFVLGDRSSQGLFVIKNTPTLWTSSPLDFSVDDMTRIDFSEGLPDRKGNFQVLMLDVNNDGNTDILRVGEGEIVIMHGDGNRSFMRSKKTVRPPFRIQPRGFSLGLNPVVMYGHVNGDPLLDLVVLNESGKGWVLLNRKGEGFHALFVLDFSPAPSLCLGDFNGDGLDDLVAYGLGERTIKILLNDGRDRFSTLVERSLGSMSVKTLSVHDINRDGLSDIIMTLSPPQGGVEGRVLLNISRKFEGNH